ncbi:MAG TPA: hypothetical protein VLG37_01660 [Candidatus Saccharimonadales bacterium]|nr:hypothetical protein [Candidatus Saccharimonadales bacterium]
MVKELSPRPAIKGEVAENDQIAKIIYARSGIDELLEAYAFRGAHSITETEIDAALGDYATDIARLATASDGIDVELVHQAFDQVFKGMNTVAERKHGKQPPPSPVRSLLTRIGLSHPAPPINYVHVLDEKYWAEQFMDQYRSQSFVKRQPNELEASYAARYIHHCLHGFALAPFSYLFWG